MRNLRILLFLLPLLLGCATTEDITYLEYRLFNLEERVRKVEKQQRSLSQGLKDLGDQLRGSSSAMQSDLGTLKERMEALEEDQKAKGELLQELLVKLGKLERDLKELKEAKLRTSRPRRELSKTPEELYHLAFDALRQGDYPRASKLFSEFLKRFPEHELADNAQFWLGECFFKQKDYERAILEYEKVLSRYPKGNKVPAAMLKEGLAFLALGDEVTGRYLLQKLIKKYPSSPEAELARQRLKVLSEGR